MDSSSYSAKVGTLIQETRQARGMTQAQLAQALGTSQSAINRIEKGGQNISLDMLNRISEVLSSQIVTLNPSGTVNFRVEGGKAAHQGRQERGQDAAPPSAAIGFCLARELALAS